MGQIKRRLLDAIDLAEDLTPGVTTYQHEYVALHIRKLLEQIAYSSLIVNGSAYQKHYPKFVNEWRPTQILRLIEKINPKFYPQPVEAPDESNLVALKDGFMTRDDFEFLYKKTHELLHTPHPNEPFQDESQWRYSPRSWLVMIGNLLKFHVVHVAESNQLLIVELGTLDQGPRITTAVYGPEI
jgi:hypothetical protein